MHAYFCNNAAALWGHIIIYTLSAPRVSPLVVPILFTALTTFRVYCEQCHFSQTTKFKSSVARQASWEVSHAFQIPVSVTHAMPGCFKLQFYACQSVSLAIRILASFSRGWRLIMAGVERLLGTHSVSHLNNIFMFWQAIAMLDRPFAYLEQQQALRGEKKGIDPEDNDTVSYWYLNLTVSLQLCKLATLYLLVHKALHETHKV